jgi:hypothetical protein
MTPGILNKDCAWKGRVGLSNVRKAVESQNSILVNGKTIPIFEYKNSPSANATVASTANLDPEFSVFLTERECLSCCMRTVLAVDREECPYFCIMRFPV